MCKWNEVPETTDEHRADDDGMGKAVGTQKITDYVDVAQDTPDDNDLGTQWGPSSPIPTAAPADVTEAFAQAKAEGKPLTYDLRGAAAIAEMDKLYAVIDKLVAESKADPLNTRIAVITFHMNDVDQVTGTAAGFDRTQVASSVGDDEVIKYAEYLVARKIEAFYAGLQAERPDEIGQPLNTLEI